MIAASKETLPDNLTALAENNSTFLDKLGVSTEQLRKEFRVGRRIGQDLMDSLYPGYRESKLPKLRTVIEDDDNELLDQIISKNVALFLVRPEMVHLTPEICSFLATNQFSIKYVDKRVITAESYATLYHEIFARPQAKPALPTRTLVYMGHVTNLIVFTDPLNRYPNLPNGVVEEFKGVGGVEDSTTVRGSVVFREALRIGFNRLEDEDLALALDPLHVYRHLISLRGSFPHSHLPKERALLNYNAVSVHVPNKSEIRKDLGALNTSSQLKEIYENIK
jgi:hypothetical protein